jgi:hypothetical protein
LFAGLPSSRESGILIVYILRSVRDGGAAGREFVESMIQESLAFTLDAVARGIVVPSRDEEARVRFLIHQSIGNLVVRFAMRPDTPLDDFQAVTEQMYADTMLPTLELYTEGLFTDSTYLDQYLAYVADTNRRPAGLAGESK